MLTAYNPVAVEAAWQDWWEAAGFFSCSDDKISHAKPDERFVMVIPPPNVTGSLHLGHALTVAIQDALTRWHRMLGHATLWVPGTDHAGIATQSVVEKRLLKEEGKSRHDLGREQFLERVWDWKNQYESRIHHQFRSVGCSVDWNRKYFSMDENCARAVSHAFCQLWEEDNCCYRLETMLGDTGVAVHPEDKRYKHCMVNMWSTRLMAAEFNCARPVLVDMSFGTGAVKITPAHDPNDYESINENGGEFAGMMRYDARIAVERRLKLRDCIMANKIKMRLGICSRSGDIIEPLVKPQWFINCDQMAKDAMAAVTNKELTILPEVMRNLLTLLALKTKHCRQKCRDASDRWFAGISEETTRKKAATKLGVSEDKIELEQDEDVLDTWVSAGLFPFAVLVGRTKRRTLETFIQQIYLRRATTFCFFWVARMVFLGQKLTGKLPFKTIYLHSMVRDKYGRKMSKSLGNVVDPLEIIAGCSLDDLLQKLESGNLPAKEVEKAKKRRDINLDIGRLVGYRNFCNKLWNAVRFAMSNLEVWRADERADAESKLTAQQTLYVCLEFGLRLLHPSMPFVTEELWQRLPAALDREYHNCSYPLVMATWTNTEVEANMELVKEVIHAARSVRAEYGLTNSVRPTFFIKCSDKDISAVIESQLDDLTRLPRQGNRSVFVDEEAPQGCAMHSVNDKVQIFVLLAGLVDFANEITKLSKKLAKIAPSLDSLSKKMSRDDYKIRYPRTCKTLMV
ncbi:putative valine-tRNA ligase, valyl/Leucyl/Isoleucyl-tRNA synthetase, editing [Plasmopara halstedii]